MSGRSYGPVRRACVGKTGQMGFIVREGTAMRKQQESCPPGNPVAPDRALDLNIVCD